MAIAVDKIDETAAEKPTAAAACTKTFFRRSCGSERSLSSLTGLVKRHRGRRAIDRDSWRVMEATLLM
jgi:hypothetical protein